MTSPLKCLLIEDEPLVAHFITQGLVDRGHSVVSATDGEAGIVLVTSEHFSVVILDVGLPGRMDGFDVAERIRHERVPVPILMLTGRSATEDVIKGLEAGADDYVIKPFAFLEFEARLRALARRSEREEDSGHGKVRFGPLELDPLTGSALRDRAPLALTPTEYRILDVLVGSASRTVTRAELLSAVWGFDFDPGTRLIDVHIANLRRKLEDGGYERIVVTERGVGFRAVPPGN